MALLLLLVWLYATILPRLFRAVGRAPPRPELRARDLRPILCFVCSVAGPQETESNCISTIMGWPPAGRAEHACAGSGSPGRGNFLLASVAPDPAGGSDHSVSGMEVLSRGPVPLVVGLKSGFANSVLSSPALFQLEHHSRSNDQSFQRYPRYEIWLIEFLAPRNCTEPPGSQRERAPSEIPLNCYPQGRRSRAPLDEFHRLFRGQPLVVFDRSPDAVLQSLQFLRPHVGS